MSPKTQAAAAKGAGKVSAIRELLAKAGRDGLTSSEAIELKGELARLQARVAAVNARFGRTVVELGPSARSAVRPGASAAMAV